jgi:hypothetical protein
VDTDDGIKMCVYGRGKTGKTRLACTFPKPLLLIGTEKGTKTVKNVQGVDYIRLQSSADIDELLALLREGKYKTAVLDTAGGLQDLILKEILGLDDIPVQRSWGMAKREDWMSCGAQWKERVRGLIDLSDMQGLNVVVIAHERNFNEDQASDVMIPSVGAALTPTAAAWLNAAVDYIAQTYIRQQDLYKEVKGVRLKSGSEIQYCLRVGPHPVFQTGFRLPDSSILPDSIVNPEYAIILRLIHGKAIEEKPKAKTLTTKPVVVNPKKYLNRS